MKKIYDYFAKNYIVILWIIIFVFSMSSMVCENDLYFDLKTGEDIFKNGLTFEDHFSFIPGLNYVYLHWFYDIFIYLLYKITGWGGLFIFFSTITSLFFIVFYKEVYKIKKDKLVSFIITFILFWIGKYAFVSRVQTIIYLLLFLEVINLEKLYKTGDKKYAIYLILLSILVVNLQMPIWIFYVILTLPFIAESLISKIFKNRFEDCKSNKVFYITIFLIIVSGLISPYGFIPYTYCLKSLGNRIYDLAEIGEMRYTVLLKNKFILVIALLFVICEYFKYLKISLRDFCLICGLFLFSLIVVKNIIFFYIFGIYIFIKSIDLTYITNKLKKFYDRLNLRIIECVLIIICSIFVINVFNFKYNKFDKYGYDTYPVKIVDYLKNNTDYKNIKLFNDYNAGSFYLFNDIKVFIDSRAEVYMKEYNGGKDILYDYVIIGKKSKTKEIIDKYEFDYLIVDRFGELFYYLNKEEGYCIVSSDSEFFILEKYNEKKSIKNV